jgi:hypothetical protein
MPLSIAKLPIKGDDRKSDAYTVEKHPHTPPKDLLPSYAAEDPINEPSIEELNAAFSNLNIPENPPPFPSPEHCLVHLKLLNVFHAVKEDIGYTDGLFGLWDSRCEIVEGKDREKLHSRIREKRWAIYLARAVERFEDWWLKVLCPREDGKRLQGKEMVLENKSFVQFPETGVAQNWTKAMLPPVGKISPTIPRFLLSILDVLMVWHAFMLNPRNYLEDCIRYGLKDLWATGMPWQAVNASIDTKFNYDVPEDGVASFMRATGHNWNNADDPRTKMIICPRCTQQLDIPWTTFGDNEKPSLQE